MTLSATWQVTKGVNTVKYTTFTFTLDKVKWKFFKTNILTLSCGKGEILNHSKNVMIYKTKAILLTNCYFKKSLHNLDNGASTMQVDILNM